MACAGLPALLAALAAPDLAWAQQNTMAPTAAPASVSIRPSALDYATPEDSAAQQTTGVNAPPITRPVEATQSRDGAHRSSAPLPEVFESEPSVLPEMPLATPSSAANYGKPHILVPGKKKPKTLLRPPLPTLVPYPTSAEARRDARLRPKDPRLDPSDPNYVAPSPNTAQLPPIPMKQRPKVDDDPFAPTGLNLGLLRVKPYLETDFGFADNPNLAPAGSPLLRGSAFVREEFGLSTLSEWNNHSFTGDMKLGYTDYFSDHAADAPDGSGKFTLRLDATRNTKINIDGSYTLTTLNPTSPNLNNGGQPTTMTGRPIIATYGGGLGVAQTFNRLELSLRGSADRTYWGDAHFTDGTTQLLSQDSYTAYGLTSRASYELTPGVKPFVEVGVDRRIHDSSIDTSGYARNSEGFDAKGGSTFELTRLLTGEVSAGYANRHYEDQRLSDLRGPVFDSSLVWTATGLTKVTLHAATTMDETTIAGSSGAITRTESLEIAHALLRDLTFKATGSIAGSTFQNVGTTQTLYQMGLAAEYNLNRSVVLRASATHQKMVSNQANTDYTGNVFMLGLKLQR